MMLDGNDVSEMRNGEWLIFLAAYQMRKDMVHYGDNSFFWIDSRNRHPPLQWSNG